MSTYDCEHGFYYAFGCHDCTTAYSLRADAREQFHHTARALVRHWQTIPNANVRAAVYAADEQVGNLLEAMCTHYDRSILPLTDEELSR